MTTIPNDTLYVDTFSDFQCNVTISGYVDTPTTIMYQWLGPSLLTTGADYNISGDTLRINQFNMMRDNDRTITCMATVLPSSGQQYVLHNNASESIQLTVEGKLNNNDSYFLIIIISSESCCLHSSCHYSWCSYCWRQLQYYLYTGWSDRETGSDSNQCHLII